MKHIHVKWDETVKSLHEGGIMFMKEKEVKCTEIKAKVLDSLKALKVAGLKLHIDAKIDYQGYACSFTFDYPEDSNENK